MIWSLCGAFRSEAATCRSPFGRFRDLVELLRLPERILELAIASRASLEAGDGLGASESADAALAVVAAIVDPHNVEAVVLCVWEPLTLQALRAERFGGWPAVPLDVTELDEQTEKQAEQLAEHGARLAREHGYDARGISVADQHDVAGTILATADELELEEPISRRGRLRPGRPVAAARAPAALGWSILRRASARRRTV